MLILFHIVHLQIDAMGDKVGRVYVDAQDLSQLQARKFKGLKSNKRDSIEDGTDKPLSGGGGEGRKRVKTKEVVAAEEVPMDE